MICYYLGQTKILFDGGVRMRKKILVSLIGGICVVLILTAQPILGISKAAEKVIKWKIQTMWVPGGFDHNAFSKSPEGFCSMVEKASGGRLKIIPFSAGSIVPVFEHVDAVGKGVIQGSATSPAYWAGKIPVAGFAACLPYNLEGLSDVDTYIWELGTLDIVREAYSKFNIYPVTICNNTDSPLMSRKPVRRLEDFRGLKVRVVGMQADVMKRLGASVTLMPSPEIYMALERGVLEATNFGGIKSETDLGLHEVTKYILLPPVSESITSELMVNLDSWNALSDDLKSIVETSAYYWATRYSRQLWLLNQQKMNELVSQGKMEVIRLPSEDVAKLRKIAYEVIKDYSTTDAYCARAFKILDDYLRLQGYVK